MREHLLPILKQLGHEVLDFGADGQASVDYPDYASPALRALISGQVERTILVCGSGVGMSIVANRIPGVRCALAVDVWTAEMSRRHNDTNCLALRAREQDPKVNVAIVEKWLATDFEGDRHRRRIEKIEEIAAALRKEL